MNLITDTWRQLVRRRLWPVALLLVAAAAAVPFLLGKTPESNPVAAPAASAATAKTDDALAKPVVALVDDKQAPAKRRRVLGAQKDPFEPAPLPKPKKTKKAKAATKQAEPKPEATTTPEPSASTAPSEPVSPVTPAATPVAPKKTFPHGSLEVRFGNTDGDLHKSTLERLEVLPSGSPLLVFDGLKDKNRTAKFMVTGDVALEGDGHCDPTPDSCETLELRKGETEFLTVKGSDGKDVVYELDLVAIH